MKLNELCRCTDEELREVEMFCASNGNLRALGLISDVRKYNGKMLRVVKGRKVPVGTEGRCFWLGAFDNSKYGDPWGIYTTVKVGIKDEFGNAHFTSVDNVEVVAENEEL